MTSAPKRAPTPEELWAQLEALPEHLKGEIVDGELFVQPRPRFRHARTIGFIGRHLGGAFDYDDDGPGGWWIVPEPGIELSGAPEVSPDLAGWRRTTMPVVPPPDDPLRIVPDWVCEVLSPTNARWDHTKKLPFCAKVGVQWAWLIDLRDRTLEVRELQAGAWVERQVVSSEERVRLPPFEAIEMPLARLWLVESSE